MRIIHSLFRRLLPSPIPIHCGQAARLEFLHSGRAAFYIPANFADLPRVLTVAAVWYCLMTILYAAS